MAYPMPRNQARKIVADAREFGISNDEALAVIVHEMLNALCGILGDDDIPDMMIDDVGEIGDEM